MKKVMIFCCVMSSGLYPAIACNYPLVGGGTLIMVVAFPLSLVASIAGKEAYCDLQSAYSEAYQQAYDCQEVVCTQPPEPMACHSVPAVCYRTMCRNPHTGEIVRQSWRINDHFWPYMGSAIGAMCIGLIIIVVGIVKANRIKITQVVGEDPNV